MWISVFYFGQPFLCWFEITVCLAQHLFKRSHLSNFNLAEAARIWAASNDKMIHDAINLHKRPWTTSHTIAWEQQPYFACWLCTAPEVCYWSHLTTEHDAKCRSNDAWWNCITAFWEWISVMEFFFFFLQCLQTPCSYRWYLIKLCS